MKNNETSTSRSRLILGTAGHIDHGKTALIRALTGTDTDRLPQEKARGMTIDIGFAELELGELQLGIVDVPGHERFVKNMLAGAAAIDLALLIVAADDSVMPQTREHVAILELLGIEHGVIALTKCDLRDDEWLELVAEDVRDLVQPTGLADAPLVRTSVPPSGEATGLVELRRALAAVAARVPSPVTKDLFRMCVDRSFTVAGRGTVVTGTVCSGRAKVGDELEWLSPAKPVQIRGLENHGRVVDAVARGQRAAINLAGVRHAEIERGDTLAAPGMLRPSRRLTVNVRNLPESPWPIKHRGRYTLHIGTQAVGCDVYCFSDNTIRPGKHGFARLECREPVAAVWGQPFVLRMESPLATLGGGTVVQPVARPIRRRQSEMIEKIAQLAADNPLGRIAAAVYFLSDSDWNWLDLCRDSGLSPDEGVAAIKELETQGVVVRLLLGNLGERVVHADALTDWQQQLLCVVTAYQAAHPLQASVATSHVAKQLENRLERCVCEAIVERMLATGTLVGNAKQIGTADFSPKLSKRQQLCYEQLKTVFREAGFQPPLPSELSKALALPSADLRQLLGLVVAEGLLAHLGGDIYLWAATEAELRKRTRAALAGSDGMTVSDIRDLLGTSRKFAVPICEYLDRIGLTRREGDLRRLA